MNFKEKPLVVIWEVTRACQLACLHCRAEAIPERNPDELSYKEGIDLIDQVAEMGSPVFVFTGGDPLMRSDLFDLADHAVKKGVRASVSPSATPLVTKENMRKAKEVGLWKWAFSLDGSTAEIHDRFRGTSGSFDLTMQSLEYLKELEMPIQLNTTVSQYNMDDLENIARIVEEMNATMWSVFFMVPTGRANLDDVLSPSQHEKVLRWLAQLSRKVPYAIKTTAAQHYRRILIQLYGESAVSEVSLGVNDGKGFVFISHTGDVYPSGFLPVKAGNIREKSLKEIYRESPVFKALRDSSMLKGKCGWCEYKEICGGSRARAFGITGDYLESEPFCTYIPDPRKK